MKLLIAGTFLVITTSSFAFPMMDTKERVRIELWFEGIDGKKPERPDIKQKNPLPMELEHALLKL